LDTSGRVDLVGGVGGLGERELVEGRCREGEGLGGGVRGRSDGEEGGKSGWGHCGLGRGISSKRKGTMKRDGAAGNGGDDDGDDDEGRRRGGGGKKELSFLMLCA
jgi:hypothetical protein